MISMVLVIIVGVLLAAAGLAVYSSALTLLGVLLVAAGLVVYTVTTKLL